MTDLDERLQRLVSRRRALQGAGGLALAGLAGGLLAGCGSDSGGDGGGSTTIAAWHEHPELRRPIEELLTAFHAAHPSISVDMSYKPADQYEALLQTALVGGAAPDALGFLGAARFRQGLRYATPVGAKVDPSRLTLVAKAATVNDGKVWGVPLASFTVGLFYNRAIFAEHGLEPPKSWGELMTVARTLQDKGVTPFSMPAQDMIIPFFFYMLAVTAILGETTVEDLATGRRKLTEPELVRAAQLMIDCQPYYNKGFAAVPYVEGKALFAQGRAAMIIGGTEDYAGYIDVNPKADVGVIGFPSPDGALQSTVSGNDIIYTINKKSPHKQQTAEFVAWLASDEAQQIVANRIGVPVVRGVTPTGAGDRNRVEREFIAAGNPAGIVWLESDALIGCFGVAQRSAGIFTGSLDAAGFAEAMQRAIVVSS